MSHHRSHIDLTVWPITVLFAVELARLWPAIGGASAFAAASPASWLSLIVWTVVVVLSLGAYARGWGLLGRDAGPGPYRSPGGARLQMLAGALCWALILAHLLLHWFMAVQVGPVSLSQYELLRGFLSRPTVLGFYVLGLAAIGLFLSQGISAALRARGLAARPESSRWLEVGCTLVGAVMMLMAINVLSHFATGRAYWTSSSPVPTPSARDSGGRSP